MNKSGKIHKNGTSIFVTLSVVIETRKRFSEKPIIAFTNSTVFILDLYINDFAFTNSTVFILDFYIYD